MSALFPVAEVAMIATSFAAMGVLIAYASWAMRYRHSNGWRPHGPSALRRRFRRSARK